MSNSSYYRAKGSAKGGWRERGNLWKVAVTAGAAVAVFGGALGVAAAQTNSTKAAAPTVNCPTVGDKLPAVPQSAQAEIQRNLALLNTQISEANNRLVTSQGEGGPNFIQNAILTPLKDKRVATINRMATAIGRRAAKPTGLDALAPCTLNTGGGASRTESTNVRVITAAEAAAAAPTVSCPTVADKLPAVPAQARAEVERNLALLNTQISEANNRLVTSQGEGGPNFIQNAILTPLKDKRVATINRMATAIGRVAARPAGLDALAPCTLNTGGGASATEPTTVPGNGGNTGNTGGGAQGGGSTAVGTITCPDVAGRLPAIPAQAQAEVQRNLALLNTQIAEAQRRLETSVGQGGPNFVQNAILSPLASKRTATIDRIAISIGRSAARPTGLGGLANCTVN